MKPDENSIDDLLNELDYALKGKRTAPANLTLREAKRGYRDLSRWYARILRAADRGVLDQKRPTRTGVRRRAGG